MSNSLGTVLLFAVALFLGLLAGAALDLGGRPLEDVSRTARAGGRAGDAAGLSDEDRETLRRLAQELTLVRAELAGRDPDVALPLPEAPTETREAMVTEDAERAPQDLGELRDWMRSVDRRLEALASLGTLTATNLTMPPPGLRPRPLPTPLANDEAQAAFEESHMAWSAQEVIDAYGRPDVVHSDEEWEYQYRDGNGGELADVHFQFSGGLVRRIFAH